MGSLSPLFGLFPEGNNIQVIGSKSDSYQQSTTPEDEDRISISPHTVDTEILKCIIDEEDWHGLGGYQDRVQNQRFYLSDKYLSKKMAEIGGTIDAASFNSLTEHDSSDFAKYNHKIAREYELRDKLEGLLRQQDTRDLQVLHEGSLYDNYFAGEDLGNGVKSGKFAKFKSFAGFRTSKAAQKNKEDILSVCQSSAQTYVIDNASVGNIAIDEGVVQNNKQINTYDNLQQFHSNEDRRRNILSGIENFFFGAANDSHHAQRKLRVRHIQMIGIGPCLSVGIFLTSGKAFSIAGPFGTLLGFALTGSIVLATLLSFTELSTLIPVSSGFSGLASRFVEDAFGFALGWTYWFSCMISMPTQVVACTFYLRYYHSLDLSKGAIAGFTTLFMLYAVAVNLLDVRLMGEIVYITGLLKIIISIMMILAMLILNAGHGTGFDQVGFRFWDSSKSTSNLTYGLFRPTFDLRDTGNGSTNGIKGAGGRFLALASTMLISTFAYAGVEMAFVASGEAINPRKTIPSATKRTFCIVLVIYVFTIFSVSINIYSGDPRLSPYFPGSYNGRYEATVKGIGMEWQLSHKCHVNVYYNHGETADGDSSPWVLALQNYGLCTFAAVLNGILIFFTAGAEISSLFSSSRTLYAMSVQRKAPAIFERCDRRGVPYASVIFSGIFGVVGYLAVDSGSVENFSVLSNMSSASTSIIWMGLNVSFLRFYYALKTRRDIISRDERSYPYRSPFQPYLALYGLFGCSLFIIFMGFTNFIHHFWNVKSFFSAYGGLIIFVVCYVGYKIIGTSKIQRLDQLDMDTGRREMDRVIWNEYRQYSGPYREKLKHLFNWLY
ncbi:SSY1 (YDR160W) [Zygosaccharomyces parabailii]|nr:SSY1 (YDR160W) [Zygosaccharomyces parabailii]